MSYNKNMVLTKDKVMSMSIRKEKTYNILIVCGDDTILEGSYSRKKDLYSEMELALSLIVSPIHVEDFISYLNMDTLKSDIQTVIPSDIRITT
jgi:hypothetical protein